MTQQMDGRFIPVSAGDDETVRKLSAFAGKIVHEHFDPIIGAAEYLYDCPLSVTGRDSFTDCRRIPVLYVQAGDSWAGFLAFYPRGERMYLSKFYLDGRFAEWDFQAGCLLLFVSRPSRRAFRPSTSMSIDSIRTSSLYIIILAFTAFARNRPISGMDL